MRAPIVMQKTFTLNNELESKTIIVSLSSVGTSWVAALPSGSSLLRSRATAPLTLRGGGG